jgi:hypothetical protein
MPEDERPRGKVVLPSEAGRGMKNDDVKRGGATKTVKVF